MVVVVVFMEWNETARRQIWTTEPVICAIIRRNIGGNSENSDGNVKQCVNREENEQR